MFIDENPRIAIVGPTGAGKSTLARQLANRFGVWYVDADALFHSTPRALLHDQFAAALAPDRWVSDGNIGRLRDLQLPRTTTLVWLDYPLRSTLPRLLKRTLGRILAGEIVHGAFRETFRKQFLSRDSVFTFAIRHHPGLRQNYRDLIQADDASHIRVIRLATPRDTRRWLQGL